MRGYFFTMATSLLLMYACACGSRSMAFNPGDGGAAPSDLGVINTTDGPKVINTSDGPRGLDAQRDIPLPGPTPALPDRGIALNDASVLPAACSAVELGELKPQTMQAFEQLLQGRWVLCDSLSMFDTTAEDGVEFVAGGLWYKLYRDNQGKMVRGQGFDEMGQWEAIDTSMMNGPGSFQLNIKIAGNSGTRSFFPIFAKGPRKMRVANGIGLFITYAREE